MTTLEPKTLDAVSDKTKRFAIVDGPFGTQLRADEYVPEGIPLVRVTNLSFEGRFSEEDLVFITQKKAKALARSRLCKDDIIIAKTGATIGKSALFPFTDGVIASSCLKVTVDRDQVDPTYLLYRIVSPEGQNRILDGAGGSTRTTINITPLKQITFEFPPRRQQSEIASVLMAVDRAIKQIEALIAKSQRIKTGLMQDLLTRGIDEHGRLRDSVDQSNQFKNSPIGKIPTSWDCVALSRVYKTPVRDFGSFSMTNLIEFLESGVAFIKSEMIEEENLNTESMMHISPQVHQALKKSWVYPGNVLYSKIGSALGKALVYDGRFGVCNSNAAVAKIDVDETIALSRYVVMLLNATEIKSRITRSIVSLLPRLNLTDISNFMIPLPPIPEQQRMVEVAYAVQRQLRDESLCLSKLKRIKNGLMQDLLTSNVSVEPLLGIQNKGIA